MSLLRRPREAFRRRSIEDEKLRRLLAVRDEDEPLAALIGDVHQFLSPAARFRSWTYAAISRIVSRGAACSWAVWTEWRGKREQNEGPLHQLIAQANPAQDALELFTTTLLNLELYGNAYWLVERNGRKQPSVLWPVHPERLRLQAVESGVPRAWQYTTTQGQTQIVGGSDIIWFRQPGPGAALDTSDPLTAADAVVSLDILVLRYLTAFFMRGANMEYAISFPGYLDEAQYERFKARWAKRYRGLRRFFTPMVLEGGATVEKGLSFAPSEAWLRLRDQLRDEVLGIFGVPPAIVGVYEYANYANVREQRRLFWTDCLQPRLERVAAAINQQLAPQVEAGAEFAWHYGAVPELQPDYAEAVSTAAQAVKAGLLTVNEARRLFLDLDPVEWGDEQPLPAIL